MAARDTEVPYVYTVATFARWAGDFSYSLRRLREIVPPEKRVMRQIENDGKLVGPVQEFVEAQERSDPIMWVEGASEAEYFQIVKTLGLRDPYEEPEPIPANSIESGNPPTSNIVEGKHLRAVIYQISPHDYEMRAYLTDLDWEQTLFDRVADQVRIHRGTAPETDQGVVRGGTWVLEGELFRIITVDDFGLIECRATWTKRDEPRGLILLEAFRDVLQALDD